MDLSKYAASQSKYMTKALYDPNQGEVLTIAKIEAVRFSDTEQKLMVEWVEDRPPLILNKTNLDWLIANIGNTEPRYLGAKVRVWHNPHVRAMPGKAPGGLSLDMPPGNGPDQTLRQKLAEPVKGEPDDAIPF